MACAAPAQNEAVPAVRPDLPVTTSPIATTQVPETTFGTGDVEGFALDTVALADRRLRVAVADTPALRSLGLMGVGDLGGLHGMLFVFETDVDATFTMRNTLIALDIAFFDSTGRVVDQLEMVPCEEEPCPIYPPRGAFRYALEMPAGTMGVLTGNDQLRLGE